MFFKRNKHKKYNKSNTPDLKFQGKVFGVGFGKTGTTSLEWALKQFGYQLGNQPVSEMLAEDWWNKRADRIIHFCHTADAFQDVPFGMPGLYKELDTHFPKSKFILTVRDNEEDWYTSLVNFHAKIYAQDKKSIPTEAELKNANYRYKGWSLDIQKFVFGFPETPLYDKKTYLNKYLTHNKEVISFFKDRPHDLLVLNVSEKGAYQKLAKFLNVEVDQTADFPWLNKT